MYEHFHHQADIGIRGIGDTIDEAFEQAAIGMMAVICNPKAVLPEKEVKIFCNAPDEEFLLVDFLNAIIYEMAVRNMLFGKFEVTVKGDCVDAKAWGEKSDPIKLPLLSLLTIRLVLRRAGRYNHWSSSPVLCV